MRINSIEIEVIESVTARVESASKTTFKNGHKPQVAVGRGVWSHVEVLRVLSEKLNDDERYNVLVTIRTSQGVFKSMIKRTGLRV